MKEIESLKNTNKKLALMLLMALSGQASSASSKPSTYTKTVEFDGVSMTNPIRKVGQKKPLGGQSMQGTGGRDVRPVPVETMLPAPNQPISEKKVEFDGVSMTNPIRKVGQKKPLGGQSMQGTGGRDVRPVPEKTMLPAPNQPISEKKVEFDGVSMTNPIRKVGQKKPLVGQSIQQKTQLLADDANLSFAGPEVGAFQGQYSNLQSFKAEQPPLFNPFTDEQPLFFNPVPEQAMVPHEERHQQQESNIWQPELRIQSLTQNLVNQQARFAEALNKDQQQMEDQRNRFDWNKWSEKFEDQRNRFDLNERLERKDFDLQKAQQQLAQREADHKQQLEIIGQLVQQKEDLKQELEEQKEYYEQGFREAMAQQKVEFEQDLLKAQQQLALKEAQHEKELEDKRQEFAEEQKRGTRSEYTVMDLRKALDRLEAENEVLRQRIPSSAEPEEGKSPVTQKREESLKPSSDETKQLTGKPTPEALGPASVQPGGPLLPVELKQTSPKPGIPEEGQEGQERVKELTPEEKDAVRQKMEYLFDQYQGAVFYEIGVLVAGWGTSHQDAVKAAIKRGEDNGFAQKDVRNVLVPAVETAMQEWLAWEDDDEDDRLRTHQEFLSIMEADTQNFQQRKIDDFLLHNATDLGALRIPVEGRVSFSDINDLIRERIIALKDVMQVVDDSATKTKNRGGKPMLPDLVFEKLQTAFQNSGFEGEISGNSNLEKLESIRAIVKGHIDRANRLSGDIEKLQLKMSKLQQLSPEDMIQFPSSQTLTVNENEFDLGSGQGTPKVSTPTHVSDNQSDT